MAVSDFSRELERMRTEVGRGSPRAEELGNELFARALGLTTEAPRRPSWLAVAGIVSALPLYLAYAAIGRRNIVDDMTKRERKFKTGEGEDPSEVSIRTSNGSIRRTDSISVKVPGISELSVTSTGIAYFKDHIDPSSIDKRAASIAELEAHNRMLRALQP